MSRKRRKYHEIPYEERHPRHRYRYGLCLPTRRCNRFTPHGEIEGMECPVEDEIYHNTTLNAAAAIAEDGKIRVTDKGVLGQDAISLSPCPTQHYGGDVKLAIDTKGLEFRPTCYYHYEEQNKIADHGFDEESHAARNGSIQGINRIRAKYGVNLSMYETECEAVSYKDIPTSKIKRVEFWIPRNICEQFTFNISCAQGISGYAYGDGCYPRQILRKKISEAKAVAKQIGARFEVKSCFPAFKPDWGESVYVPLDKKNLSRLSRGEDPIEKKTPFVRKKDKVYGYRTVWKIPERCKC